MKIQLLTTGQHFPKYMRPIWVDNSHANIRNWTIYIYGNAPFIVHVKVTSSHFPVSRQDIFVVPDELYPVLQICVAVAPYDVLPSTSRYVWPFSG